MQPTKIVESSDSDSYVPIASSKISVEPSSFSKSEEHSIAMSSNVEISCCNIDILPLFRGTLDVTPENTVNQISTLYSYVQLHDDRQLDKMFLITFTIILDKL